MLSLTFDHIFQMKPNTYKTLENFSTIFHYKNKNTTCLHTLLLQFHTPSPQENHLIENSKLE